MGMRVNNPIVHRMVRKGVQPSNFDIFGQLKAPKRPAIVTSTDIKARLAGRM